MTQEFHISVTPVGQDEYLVRTEQVAPGVPLAEELMKWPVADWLTQAGQLMNDPLQAVLQGDAGERSLSGINLVALGQQLYNALFQGTLRDSWMTAQGIALHQQQVLRLRLGLKDMRLARLPWEVLYAGDRPLATGPYVAFSRYQAGMGATLGMPTPFLQQAGVRVLMVIAAPTDRDNLALKQEALNLQAELRWSQRTREAAQRAFEDIQLTLLEQPGREQLTQALEQGQYQVLHYAGHSNLGPAGGELYLVSDKTGLTETLSGDDLAGLLVNNGIQMAVFNSCWGAYTASDALSADASERNLAESLVKRGIRSVLAMAERIPDEVALTLTRLFYRNLSQGYPVDLSLSRARAGLIAAYGSNQLYWALPILYLQPEFDGYLTPSETPFPLTGLVNDSGSNSAPAMYSTLPDDWETPLPFEEATSDFLEPGTELEFTSEEDLDDLIGEIEYDDPAYEEDSALVSELLQELGDPTTPAASIPVDRYHSPQIATASNHRAALPDNPIHKSAPSNSNPQHQETLNADAGRTVTAKGWLQRARRNQKAWLISGAVGLVAIALLGWWFQNREPQPSDLIAQVNTPLTPDTSSTDSAKGNLHHAKTSTVTRTAIEQFNQGNWGAGQRTVEELLNRGDLQNARAALDVVPQRQANNPVINFLRGRLAWQGIQVGNKNYSLDDVRRYWETSVKYQPSSVPYHNALGFAYYVEGKLDRANQTWLEASKLLKQPTGTGTQATAPSATNTDILTCYAGLALGLNKLAQNQPSDRRTQLLNKATNLRQKVLTDDPINFQPQALSKNWLWTEKAIQDWQLLLQK